MVTESAEFSDRCVWFSTLVSKSENLPVIQRDLQRVNATEVRIIDMAQGQKKSRIVAWTFQNPTQRRRSRSPT
jgi:23S rRNA (adenine1618-N6)-methyltransferase